MENSQKKFHVYSHTHWDYEWYFTASESIVQLIYHMDEVIKALEEGTLKTYLLDSQVSILDEYLKFQPQNKNIIKKLVAEGKLMIGPWYTQSDELIISGECLARNLYYGIRFAKELGNCMMIGYLPDSFGQSKDMPKIYNGFNIHDALFWRGVPKDLCDQREFYWQNKDGSQVLCYHIKDGYFYGGNLIYTDDVDKVEKRILDGASTTHQLLPLGGDQRYVDFNLNERLSYYNERSTHDIQYVESDLESFFEELHKENNLPTIQGELIDASVSKIHHSIYSTRYDHKFLNDRVERRILYQLEPFMAMQMQMGIKPKTNMLKELWKKVLLNHAHDSACGCNSDATNEAILQRLKDCDQMSAMMLDYQIRKTSESLTGIKEHDIALYNTLPYTRDEIIHLSVATKNKKFRIVDDKNEPIEYDLVSSEHIYGGSIRKDTNHYDEDLFYYLHEVDIRYPLHAMSAAILHVEEDEFKTEDGQKSDEHFLENDFYKISVANGNLQLFNKETGKTINDFLYIEDSGDEGDTYDYSWPSKDHIYQLRFAETKMEWKHGKLSQCMILNGEWLIPSSLEERAYGISSQKIPYNLEISLDHTDVIRVQLMLDNVASEHRMRIVFRGASESLHSIADTAFGTIQREHDPNHMEDWKEIGYREEPTPIYPLLHHVSNGSNQVITCLCKGIKEYEILSHTDIALTLFRSVPLLGRPDLNRRPGIASGNEFKYIPTPDSEMKQSMEFSVGVCYRNSYNCAEIHKTWMRYANEILYYQIQEHNRFVNTQKYFVTHPYFEGLKLPEKPLIDLSVSNKSLYSSLYPVDEEHVALRIYNSEREEEAYNDSFKWDGRKIQEINMLHEKLSENCQNTGGYKIDSLAPEEIKTFKILI